MKTNAQPLPVEKVMPLSDREGAVGWLPLLVLPVLIWLLRNLLLPWAFMWAMAYAIFFGCKWLTWWPCKQCALQPWRHWAYLFAWPGLDAAGFLHDQALALKPSPASWAGAVSKTLFGAVLIWVVARQLPGSATLMIGWCGMVGLVFLLHFGSFDLLALFWQQMGVNARPLMRAPILSTSLGEFWGGRWNSAFNRIAQDLLFRRLYRRLGTSGATMAVFLASGLVHEMVISVPARGGYGLPTLYFLTQGIGILVERSKLGRMLGLRRGFAGRCFTLAVAVIPIFWLFHPPFVTRVILPFLKTIHAL